MIVLSLRPIVYNSAMVKSKEHNVHPRGLVAQWQQFPLDNPEPVDYYRDPFADNPDLYDLFVKTSQSRSATRLIDNQETYLQYLKFIARIYKSNNIHAIYQAVSIPLNSKSEVSYKLGTKLFVNFLQMIGFSYPEVLELTGKWANGILDGNTLEHNELLQQIIRFHLGTILGVERYKAGGIKELNRDFGISHPGRWYGYFLKQQLHFATNTKTHYCQAIMGDGDYNGCTLERSIADQLSFNLNKPLGPQPHRKIAMRGIEAKNHQELSQRKNHLLQRYAQGKVELYYFFGHSDANSIGLGPDPYDPTQNLTFDDIVRLDLFGKRSQESVVHPTIILNACSTGQSIAQKISEYFQALVYAPLEPSKVLHVQVNQTGPILIGRVDYEGPSVIFDYGQLVKRVDAAQ